MTDGMTLVEKDEIGGFFSVVLPDFGSTTDENPEGIRAH
jgi:hypothetical protein